MPEAAAVSIKNSKRFGGFFKRQNAEFYFRPVKLIADGNAADCHDRSGKFHFPQDDFPQLFLYQTADP